MRTREPSCKVSEAGAGACVAVLAGEGVGAESTPEAAAAANVGGKGARPATSRFVASIAVGVETEGAT